MGVGACVYECSMGACVLAMETSEVVERGIVLHKVVPVLAARAACQVVVRLSQNKPCRALLGSAAFLETSYGETPDDVGTARAIAALGRCGLCTKSGLSAAAGLSPAPPPASGVPASAHPQLTVAMARPPHTPLCPALPR